MATYFPPGMPLPAPDRDTQPFWEACRQHKLTVQRCARCGTFRMAPSPVCYGCRSFESTWEESQGVGEVYSYIIVTQSVHPATNDAVPYNAVIVRLSDCGGVRLASNLVQCANEDIRIGMPVEVVWEDVTDDVTLPRFRPLSP